MRKNPFETSLKGEKVRLKGLDIMPLRLDISQTLRNECKDFLRVRKIVLCEGNVFVERRS